MFCFIQPLSSLALSGTSAAATNRRTRQAFFSQPVRHSICRLQNPINVHIEDDHNVESKRYSKSTITMEEDTTGTVIRVVSGLMIAGLILSSVLPLSGLFKNAFSDNGDILVEEKLSKVPVFTVTDATGRPYLSENDDGRLRRGFFFMQPADAKKYLETVKDDASDAKVLVIGLDNAMKFVESKSTPAKSIPERFELFPDDHEVALAEEFSKGAFGKMFGKTGVPVFYLDGLAVRDDTGVDNVIPLFFEKEKLDEAFANLMKLEPDTTLTMDDLQIVDLMQMIKELRTGGDSRFNRVVFIPLVEAIKSLNELNSE